MAYQLTIGSETHTFDTLPEVSAFWCALREHHGWRSSTAPDNIVYEGDKFIGYVSFNGRIWAGFSRDWRPGDKPIYDPICHDYA